VRAPSFSAWHGVHAARPARPPGRQGSHAAPEADAASCYEPGGARGRKRKRGALAESDVRRALCPGALLARDAAKARNEQRAETTRCAPGRPGRMRLRRRQVVHTLQPVFAHGKPRGCSASNPNKVFNGQEAW
jgi:hypothetical protein